MEEIENYQFTLRNSQICDGESLGGSFKFTLSGLAAEN